MLDQDPDALIAIKDRMKDEDYGVAPMPKGPSGKAFPTIGFVGWSMMNASQHKDLAWKLLATLEGPTGNMEWNKQVGTLPVLKSLEKDPFYASPRFKGWFDELADPDIVPMQLPINLQEFAYFKDVYSVSTSQKSLLGEMTPDQLAQGWSDYLTKANKKAMASK
jgi:multiple sugar transport system substrate-binding protein